MQQRGTNEAACSSAEAIATQQQQQQQQPWNALKKACKAAKSCSLSLFLACSQEAEHEWNVDFCMRALVFLLLSLLLPLFTHSLLAQSAPSNSVSLSLSLSHVCIFRSIPASVCDLMHTQAAPWPNVPMAPLALPSFIISFISLTHTHRPHPLYLKTFCARKWNFSSLPPNGCMCARVSASMKTRRQFVWHHNQQPHSIAICQHDWALISIIIITLNYFIILNLFSLIRILLHYIR